MINADKKSYLIIKEQRHQRSKKGISDENDRR
jgi:hypothetical protein